MKERIDKNKIKKVGLIHMLSSFDDDITIKGEVTQIPTEKYMKMREALFCISVLGFATTGDYELDYNEVVDASTLAKDCARDALGMKQLYNQRESAKSYKIKI
ncbi:hypothetical protein JNUCC42_04370 [Brevibacterium sp. JNUCC-42]|nr:hypothetical protein JNUCC42_04370 [Brevibacterium sp. JNUCC-42]